MKIESRQFRSGLPDADRRLNDGTGSRTVLPQPVNSLLGTPGGRRPRLQRMLNPKVVAVIGATETPNSVGRADGKPSLIRRESLPHQPKATQCTRCKSLP